MQTTPSSALDVAAARFADAVCAYVAHEDCGDTFAAAEALGDADTAIVDAIHAARD